MSAYQVDASYLYKLDYTDWYFGLLLTYWVGEYCFITTTLCVSLVDYRVYGIPVELDGEDDDLEGEQSGDNMEGECWGFMGFWGFTPTPHPTPLCNIFNFQ